MSKMEHHSEDLPPPPPCARALVRHGLPRHTLLALVALDLTQDLTYRTLTWVPRIQLLPQDTARLAMGVALLQPMLALAQVEMQHPMRLLSVL